jgi:hypothetical protein
MATFDIRQHTCRRHRSGNSFAVMISLLSLSQASLN